VTCLASTCHMRPLGLGGPARSRLVSVFSALGHSCPCLSVNEHSRRRAGLKRRLGCQISSCAPLGVPGTSSTRPVRPKGRGDLARPRYGSDLSALGSSCPARACPACISDRDLTLLARRAQRRLCGLWGPSGSPSTAQGVCHFVPARHLTQRLLFLHSSQHVLLLAPVSLLHCTLSKPAEVLATRHCSATREPSHAAAITRHCPGPISRVSTPCARHLAAVGFAAAALHRLRPL
jgi:hypothetical protein